MTNTNGGSGATCHVGIDIGGSAAKLGALDGNDRILWEDAVATPAHAEAVDVLDAVAERVSRQGGDIVSIGVGLPGALDRERGVIDVSPNLPWLRGVPMREELGRRLGFEPARIRLENDANVAALGECRFGGGRDHPDMLFVTLGTGVGSGLVLGGRLHVGAGLACEIGHLCVEPDGRECGCGSRGCLETIASASAARRFAEEAGLPKGHPGDLELLTAQSRAAAGPERELLERVGRNLGHGLAVVVVLVDVRTFVFGGGFSAALDVLRPGIEAGIAERSFGERAFELLPATLGNAAGWMGAATLGA
ncbi:MAG: ROK family protein [Planctomycetes bacterium]|nr:ROK family protein [Planctomycetota bacterium]